MPLASLRDGRTLAWSEGGDPRGRPVLFFHGCPDTRRAAASGHDAARRLGVRLIAANRPGYGASTPGRPSYRRVADDVVELADELGLDTFGVLGMSVGGTFALACAAYHPERVRSAALVATPGEALPDGPALDPRRPRCRRPWPGTPPSRTATSTTHVEPVATGLPRLPLAGGARRPRRRGAGRALDERSPGRGPVRCSRPARRPTWRPTRARPCSSRTATSTTRPWSSAAGPSTSRTSAARSPSGTASGTRTRHHATDAGWPTTCPTRPCTCCRASATSRACCGRGPTS